MVDLCFITIPTKTTAKTNLAKPLALNLALSNDISSTYAGNATQDINSALEELNKLRKMAVCQMDDHESSLELLQSYYDQLHSLESKIPNISDEYKIPFKWNDAFDNGRLFIGRRSLTLTSLAYEKICVMFNIGAKLSRIGANQKVEYADELINAAKYFQQAAGVFLYVKDSLRIAAILAAIQQEPTPDLYPDTLNVFITLMTAQAQEILFMKAAKESMKDDGDMIAKFAAQTGDYYAEAMKLMQRKDTRMCREKDWLSIIACKQGENDNLRSQYREKSKVEPLLDDEVGNGS